MTKKSNKCPLRPCCHGSMGIAIKVEEGMLSRPDAANDVRLLGARTAIKSVIKNIRQQRLTAQCLYSLPSVKLEMCSSGQMQSETCRPL